MHLKNKSNDYARELGTALDAIPKAVLAAIAVSALTCGGDDLENAHSAVLREWHILHLNGIVPQKPPAKLLEGIDIEGN